MADRKKIKIETFSTAEAGHSGPTGETLTGIGRRYAYDEPHALQVARLSALLFDKTVSLHGLGKKAKVLLHAAAMLHDIGMFVSCSSHHKHSRYLIEQSGLSGFEPGERSIIALVARYHRRTLPKKKHTAFQALSRHDRLLVEKLAAYLRIADVLDRDHRQLVQGIGITLTKRKCTIAALGRNGRPRVPGEIGDKADLFEKVFRREVVFTGTREL